MSDIGLQISKPGSDANTSDASRMSASSKFPFLKTFKQGEASVNVTGPGVFSATVTHGLGYQPAFVHLESPDPNNPSRRYLGRFAAQALAIIAAESYVTKDALILSWADTSGSPGSFRAYPYKVTFYYYIFTNPLENL